MTEKLDVGSKAPDFTLQDKNGNPFHLADMIGKKVIVLYFYPADFTGGCTREACAFRDSYESFTDAGAEVIGVSDGTVENKQAFAQQNRLPFILLNDPDRSVANLYGVGITLGVFKERKTFVIDRDGVVRHLFSSQMNFGKHVESAIEIVKKLASVPA